MSSCVSLRWPVRKPWLNVKARAAAMTMIAAQSRLVLESWNRRRLATGAGWAGTTSSAGGVSCPERPDRLGLLRAGLLIRSPVETAESEELGKRKHTVSRFARSCMQGGPIGHHGVHAGVD